MKHKVLPDSFEKRRLLYGKKVSREELAATGELFLEKGRPYEAAEFFRKAHFEEGLERLRALASEEGDSCLFEFASKGTPSRDNPSAWKALGKRALELKKFSHAIRAFRRAGEEDLLREAEKAMKEVFSREPA